MRFSRLVIGCFLLTPLAASAQERRDTAGVTPRPAQIDTTRGIGESRFGVRFRPARPSLRLSDPSALLPFGRLAPDRPPGDVVAAEWADALVRSTEMRLETLWGQTASAALGAPLAGSDSVALAAGALLPPRRAALDSARTVSDSGLAAIFGDYADLGIALRTRMEAKMEQNKNERCLANQLFNPGFACVGRFQPQFDFQFDLRTGGVVADRVHVNVDYDTQREFDASNNISVYYQGRPDEILHRLEVGNVSFVLPPSRFVTSGLPSGNYGVQAIGQIGPMRFRSIFAQQKGNVVTDRVFTIGDRTLQTLERDIEDYQIEPRRFFFTVDPTLLAGYPNIDILDAAKMGALARSLDQTVRPTRVFVYRLQIGAQPPNPNGPQFIVRGGNLPAQRGQIYEYLREGVDYYIDPSQLWIALVRPLNVNTERLVVAYRVRIDGRDTINVASGGTPDIEFTPEPQFANLIWDPTLRPQDPAFNREIRSVYRLGGADLLRETVSLRIVAGAGGDQEKPAAGTADTYLEMFGMAQPTNASSFDVENRLWPRPSDPNLNRGTGGGTDTRLIRDYFVVFPSLEPFARRGLVEPGNPSNDTLYSIRAEDLYSTRRPQAVYQLRARYQSAGSGDAQTLMLGTIQLRQQSERILIDGIPLTRGADYTVDYELGRVTFTRADTLFVRPRQVAVQYEENPLFATAPTSMFGVAAQFPTERGELNFTLVSQSQQTTFTRPTLGFEPASSLVAGVSGGFSWNATALTAALDRLPIVSTSAPSSIAIQGEFATSRPQPNSEGEAFVESFESEGGIGISLDDAAWYYSSRPLPLGSIGPSLVDSSGATTLAWQNTVLRNGRQVLFFVDEIDTRAVFVGSGVSRIPERLLWLTLYPTSVGGLYDPSSGEARWRTGLGPTAGRRWRSIRTVLSPSGTDLTRVEQLEFWALVDTTAAGRQANPLLAFDFGTISENSLAFAPETLYVRGSAAAPDSIYGGRRVQGADSLNTERDPLSRTFNAAVNDRGLPGDRIDTLRVVDEIGGGTRLATQVAICGDVAGRAFELGDARGNCTVRNSRLDEEDIDQDNVLNMTSAEQPAREQFVRYLVDLADESRFYRVTTCYGDDGQRDPAGRTCWVQVRVPFAAPADSVNAPDLRRVRALRLTMISGAMTPSNAFLTVPLARMRLVGPPWLKRAEQTLAGAAGEARAGGTVLTGVIGTNDSTATVVYQPPPGIINELDTKNSGFIPGLVQINERSLRVQALGLEPLDRAEAYLRFPEGEKSFMGYGEMRVWVRGQGRGWGDDGELQFFVKIGRDPDNFYMYRTPAQSGSNQLAWRDVRVDFERLFTLRAQVQNAFLRNSGEFIQCTGLDLELVQRSPLPPGATNRYAACEDGYIVYTTDANLTPPNLAAVQELAVGMLRVPGAPGSIVAGDTLELWVDDIRLTDVLREPGYAGQLGVSVVAGDVATVRVNIARKDAHFRQLAQQPSFVTDDALDLASSLRLDKLLPQSWGLALPVTVTHTATGREPLFLSRSDVRGSSIDGLRTPRSSATSYALTARRVTPLGHGVIGDIVDNLTLRSTWAAADSRTEYSTGAARSWSLGLEYDLAAAPRTTGLPTWVRGALGALPDWLSESSAGRAVRDASIRWTPTRFVLSSALARSTDRRTSFLTPVTDAPDDEGRVVRGLSHIWRNGSSLELRPVGGLTVRWDITSLRDLRDYGDTPAAIVAEAERGSLFGMDIGLERERAMSTGISAAPLIARWIRPTLSFGTTFTMSRDPNARTLVALDSTAPGDRLPRRLTNQQILSAGAQIDLPGAFGLSPGDSGLLGRIAAAVRPIDINATRSLLSAFDGTPVDPPLGYQFALGGVGAFRDIDGRLATSAGVTRTLTVSHSLALPFGLSLLNRYNRVSGTNWLKRLGDVQSPVRNATETFPDLSLRWSFRPPWLGDVITSVGSQLGFRRTLATSLIPVSALGVAERSEAEIRQLPLNASITWIGGFSTAAGYNLTSRDDDRPGSRSTSESREVNAEIGKSFRPPQRWDLRSDIRVRIGYQASQTETFTFSTLSDQRSRLTDNGRYAVNLNADTDLSDNLSFTLQGARVVTFDRNFDRRFTQTVISAVFQLDFFSGELR